MIDLALDVGLAAVGEVAHIEAERESSFKPLSPLDGMRPGWRADEGSNGCAARQPRESRLGFNNLVLMRAMARG